MNFSTTTFFVLLIIFSSVDGLACDEHNSSDEILETQRNVKDIIDAFTAVYPVKSWMEHGFFDYEYLKIINVHWLKFPPQHPLQHYFLAAIYTVIMCCGATGNLLVIFMYFRTHPLQTPANVLVMNLAFSDLLMMSKMPIFIYNSIYQGPALGDKVCRYYGFIGGLSGTCSICLLATISINRYFVVKHPLRTRFTCRQAKIFALCCWAYSIFFSGIPALDIGLGSYTPEGFLTSCSYDYLSDSRPARIFIFVFFLAAWVIPFTVITFAYKNIIRIALVARNLQRDNTLIGDFRRHIKSEKKRQQEVQLALVVFAIIAAWFLAWTPYAVVSLLGITGFGHLITPSGSMVPALFAKVASCVNPFLYALTNPTFKREMRLVFCRGASRWENTQHFLWSVKYRGSTRTKVEQENVVDTVSSSLVECVTIQLGESGGDPGNDKCRSWWKCGTSFSRGAVSSRRFSSETVKNCSCPTLQTKTECTFTHSL